MTRYKQFDMIDRDHIQGSIPCKICDVNVVRGLVKRVGISHVCSDCCDAIDTHDFLEVVRNERMETCPFCGSNELEYEMISASSPRSGSWNIKGIACQQCQSIGPWGADEKECWLKYNRDKATS
jgi:hypothetical protein